jgi:hypothetical protein
VLLGWIVAVDGFLGFSFGEAPIVSLAIIACLMLVAGRTRYKVRLDALAPYYDRPVPLARGWRPSAPPGERLSLPDWKRDRPTLVLVAVSGGGIRAALWTASILTELERTEVRGRRVVTPWNMGLITGASGGMVGATYYTLTLRQSTEGESWHVVDRSTLLAAVAEESLSDVAQRLVFHDLPLALVPKRHSRSDRGTRLDHALERHLRSRLPPGTTIPSTIAQLLPLERRGLVPSLVYTPMLVEDGRRLFISNANLDRLATSDGNLLDGTALYSRNAFQLHELFEDGLERMSPWTAARLSASFPYVTPAPVLPTVPRRRVVDAGYWDNFGVNVCSSWLEDCLSGADRRAWLGQFGNVLLVQVRDGVLCYGDKEAPSLEPSRTIARGLEGLTSPPEAVLAARNAVTVYRGDEQVETLSEIFGPAFSTVTLEFQRTASLSWALTEEEARLIEEDARREVARVAPMMADFVTPAHAPIARPAWFHHSGDEPSAILEELRIPRRSAGSAAAL